jgi:abequosyltransferase
MPADAPLLTIAVPTYNRAVYLSRLLSSIASQPQHGAEVEILVSDNASSDNTGQVVEDFRKAGQPIRYLRNDQNVGSDRNFLQCYEQANGRYVWIVGDDEVLEPNALQVILPYLSSGKFDLIHLRPRNFQGEYTPKARSSASKATVFERAEDLARHVHVSFTFISGNIIKKATVSNSAHPPFAELLGTNLVQLGWTYAAVNNHRRSLLIHDRLIAALVNNTGGYQLTKVFGVNLVKITEDWLVSPSVKRVIMRGIIQKFFPYFLLNTRERSGAFVQEDPHTVLSPLFGQRLRYWIFDYPLLCLPLPLSRSWFLLVRLLNKVDSLLGNPLLEI